MSCSATLPRGWVQVRLGDVVQPRNVRINPRVQPELKFIGMEQVEPQTMKILGTLPSNSVSSSAAFFEAGDVLYGRLRPYLNKVARPTFTGVASAEFIVFPDMPHLSSAFLQYRLNSLDFVSFASRLNTGDRPRVDFQQLADFELWLPPATEQARIVASIEELLSELDVAVAAVVHASANLPSYRASILQRAVRGGLTEDWRAEHADTESAIDLQRRIGDERRVAWEARQLLGCEAKGQKPSKGWRDRYGEPERADAGTLPTLPLKWRWVALGSIADHRLGKMLDNAKNQGSPRRYLRNVNVRWFRFDLSDVAEMRVKDEELAELCLEPEDLVVCEGGEPGRCAVWSGDEGSIVFQKALHRVRPYRGVVPSYIAVVLAADAQNGRLARSFTGSTIDHFTGEALHSYLVPLPPTEEQVRIVSEVEDAISLCETAGTQLEHALKRSVSLKQSVFSRAFSGKLIPQDPTDEPASALLERIRAERALGGEAAPARRAKPADKPPRPGKASNLVPLPLDLPDTE